MKKVMAVMAVLCFAANCFAVTPSQQKAEREATAAEQGTGAGGGNPDDKGALITWKGEITSIKRSFNQIVVKDPNTLTEKEFIVKPADIKSVKLGDSIEIKYKNGSNSAESITIAKPSQSGTWY